MKRMLITTGAALAVSFGAAQAASAQEGDELRAGDPIDIALDGGGTTRYLVARSEQFPKDAFPTRDVYQLTPGPELRLITCDGEFDRTTGHYVDNPVVFATPA